MEAPEDPTATEFYRKFSFELESQNCDDEPPNELTLAVIDERKRDEDRQKQLREWRKYFEPCPISDEPGLAKLDIERNALTEAWARLRAKLPVEQQIQFAKRPQEVGDIVKVVRNIESRWQLEKQKGIKGRIKRSFQRLCSGLTSHSNLLQILPSSSQYVSVFCGTLQTIIQAFANYEKIAEGLSRALQEITEAAEACDKECALYQTKTMQQNIADLYAHMFFFLRNTIDWYMRKSVKRALASLKEDFYQRFEDEISNIKRISQYISREAQHGAHCETRVTRMLVENLEDRVIGLQDSEREAAQRRYEDETFRAQMFREVEATRRLEIEKLKRLNDLHRSIGESAKALFLKEAANYLSGRLEESKNLNSSGAVSESKSIMKDEGLENRSLSQSKRRVSLDSAASLTKFGGKDELQYHSRHLEDSIVSGEIMIPYDRSPDSFFDWQVVSALEEWTTSTASQILCVVGPGGVKEPCATALVASQYLDLAIQSEIPVISFFCKLPRQRRSSASQQTPESVALISLTYALIRQLIELLPSTSENHPHSLGQQRFALLDGSSDSLEDAFKVLGELLDLAPPMLLCVIDGFQQLDDQSTRRHLAVFLETLRGHRRTKNVEPEGSDRLLKILFTTAGRSRCLLDGLSREELVFAERLGTFPASGRANPGRRSLSPRLLADLRQPVEQELD